MLKFSVVYREIGTGELKLSESLCCTDYSEDAFEWGRATLTNEGHTPLEGTIRIRKLTEMDRLKLEMELWNRGVSMSPVKEGL